MPTFLYDLPNWLVGTLICAIFITVGLGGFTLFHRVVRTEFTDFEKSVSMTMLQVIATVNALLLAFSAVSVWEAFAAADAAVMSEADTIGELSRDLAVFDSEPSRQARQLLRQYAVSVLNNEWETMREGAAHDPTWTLFDEVFRTIGIMEPDTPRRVALMPEIWAKANELLGHRRDRLFDSQAAVPATLWGVVTVGTILTLLTTFVLSPTRFSKITVTGLALALGLVFYFIVAMDRPFAGEQSISPAPFENAIANMQRWDEGR
jgi:hypothetical protein